MKFTNLLTVFIAIIIAFGLVDAAEKFIISGRIIDQENGEIMRGATVQLIGTKKGAKTDMKGSFRIKDVESGSYSLKITYIGYKEKEVKEVNVVNANISLGDIVLYAAVTETKEVVVSASRILDNQAAMLSQRKNAAQLSDGISTEEIKKTSDADAGQALKRVSGITLVNDKFIYIRGVSERYSNTTLNG